MRVLYVDDDRVNAMLFVETCRVAGGIEVETAASGTRALEVAVAWRPEVLVIDLHLPDMLGYELLPRLRARLAAASIPAFLCTADAADEVAAPARAAGFDACWAKPVDLRVVIAALARLRGGAGGAQ